MVLSMGKLTEKKRFIVALAMKQDFPNPNKEDLLDLAG